MITITLLAFLVLLLVSLATLTRVETQVAGNNQLLVQSRQNALFALNLALGQLQKYAGPDRRVTAPSNTGSAATAPGRSDSQPHWTGVWKQTSPASPTLPQEMYSPELLTWLVSGNETTRTINPSDSIADPTASANSPTVWLVNEGSVAFAGAPGAGNPDTRIKLPRQEIRSAAVPGQSADTPVGHYAWWVGDEGVKARADLADPFDTPAATDTEKRYRLLSAQRMNVARMSTELAAHFPAAAADRAALANVVADAQLPLAVPAVETAEWRRRFHDLGVRSRGVLSDTRNGGLRRDLTWMAARPDLTALRSAVATAWADTGATPVADAYGAYRLAEPGVSVPAGFHVWERAAPTWEQLWSYARLGSEVDAAGVIAPRAQSATAHGVFPIVVQMRLFFGLRRERVLDANGEPVSDENQNHIYLHTRPSLVLANPYNVTLAATTYHLTVDFLQGFAAVRNPTTVEERFGNWASLYNRIKFRVVAEAIPPGEARIFSLQWRDAANDWSESTLSYAHTTDGTYTLVNDYDAGQASLRRAPVRIFTKDECETAYLYGSQSEFGVVLWNDNPSDDRTVLQFNDRVSGSAMDPMGPVGLPDPAVNPDVVWGGGFYHLLADAALFSPPGGNLFGNYVQEVNLRAPVRSSTAGAGSAIARFPVLSNGTAQRPSDNHFTTRQKVAPDNKRVVWGLSYQDTTTLPQTVLENVAYSVPRDGAPLVSLGQLQHFNAGGFVPSGSGGLAIAYGQAATARPDAAVQELAFDVARAIGHSRAPRVNRRDEVYTDQGASNGRYHDASYLLNTALWDRFYFSTVPQAGAFDFASGHLIQTRYAPFRAGIASDAVASYRDSATAAARNLLVDGAFNVNSTSVAAWKALLAGLLNVPFNGAQSAGQAPLPRTPFQPGGPAQADDSVSANAWRGYRQLTAAQLDTLAAEVVAEVKKRGPFLSLADFVNRRLISNTTDPQGTGIMGALEAAIQAAGLNPAPPTGSAFAEAPPVRTNEVDAAHRLPNLIAGHPGWLSQADLLQPLAPCLSARSDTFRIRAYGDAVNPATSALEGRAWCEAIVQRLPDLVGGEAADTSLAAPGLSDASREFGRRFQVVSFRWLGPGDI